MKRLVTIFPKKVMRYFKLVTFSVLLVTAVTFCPPMHIANMRRELNEGAINQPIEKPRLNWITLVKLAKTFLITILIG